MNADREASVVVNKVVTPAAREQTSAVPGPRRGARPGRALLPRCLHHTRTTCCCERFVVMMAAIHRKILSESAQSLRYAAKVY